MYTDFVGNPINEGDDIVYAQAAYSGSASLYRTAIFKIIPLVDHPSGRGYARDDQRSQSNPTKFTGTLYEDPSKRFVIQIMRPRWRYINGQGMDMPTKYTLPSSNSIMVVK